VKLDGPAVDHQKAAAQTKDPICGWSSALPEGLQVEKGAFEFPIPTASRSLTIVESSKETGTLRAQKGVSLSSWGEVVGVFIRPSASGAPAYMVEVQSFKRNRLQLTGEDWTATLVSGMKAELGQ
jgi:hypothetical protein